MIAFNFIRFSATFRWTLALSVLIIPQLVQAQWQVIAGGESPNRGSQALAFLPNELWVHTGDSIRWTFPTHERHTLTFLKPGQTRPPGFGPIFGIPVGCPGLIHADMTGVVHVLNPSQTLPHDQDFYDQQAQSEQVLLLADASRLEGRGTPGHRDRAQSSEVATGIGEVVTTTGGGSQTASLMRFLRDTIVVQVGDTVEWTSLDPSINHTVTFGVEPADPRPRSGEPSPVVSGCNAFSRDLHISRHFQLHLCRS